MAILDHQLTMEEQGLLDGLLERFRFTPIVIRLTATMLEKSIIDARATIQSYLARTGLVDYAAIPQGPEGKIQLGLPFVSGSSGETRLVSFYRPTTKSGDPRLWVGRLRSIAEPGDALVLAFSGTDVVVVHLNGSLESLASALAPLLPSTFEDRGRLEALVRRLGDQLQPLSDRWIKTGRSGPTGVGFTLETWLGIAANSSQLSDFEGLELKAYRRGALTGPGKLVSLFAKTPNWLGVEKGLGLLENFGYRDDTRGRLALYCTITNRRNPLGWSLEIEPSTGRVLVCHEGHAVLSYPIDTLDARLREKHPATLFVRASSRGKGKDEEFRYDEVTLCREPSLVNFLELIQEGLLGLDFTLHQKADGKARDHGYLWRIRESAIPYLYAYRRVISSREAA